MFVWLLLKSSGPFITWHRQLVLFKLFSKVLLWILLIQLCLQFSQIMKIDSFTESLINNERFSKCLSGGGCFILTTILRRIMVISTLLKKKWKHTLSNMHTASNRQLSTTLVIPELPFHTFLTHRNYVFESFFFFFGLFITQHHRTKIPCIYFKYT